MIGIVTLNEVKDHLDKTDSKDDAELLDFIQATTRVVEEYVGVILPKTFVERHAGNGMFIRLFKGPVLSITSIEGFLAPLATPIVPADYVLQGDTSTIYSTNGYGFTTGPYKITYQAGRSFVEPNWRAAAKIIVAHMWTTQRGNITRLPVTDEASLPPGYTYSVPRKALELLRGERRDRVVVA
jgi:hypothetical protein